MTSRGQEDRRQASLMVIRWTNADGSESEGHPLPRPQAEALLRAFREHFPRLVFRLEVPGPLARA